MTKELKTPPAHDLRAIIRTAAPEAREGISYRIPVFIWNGPLVFFAAFPNHLGFYVVSKQIMEQFKDDLKPYKVSGTTIHFSASHPLPASLITGIVRARIAENGIQTSESRQINRQYVAFLRGINVGGHKSIKMLDLKSAFQTYGFKQVETILTTGNVVFETDQTDIISLCEPPITSTTI